MHDRQCFALVHDAYVLVHVISASGKDNEEKGKAAAPPAYKLLTFREKKVLQLLLRHAAAYRCLRSNVPVYDAWLPS